MDRSTPLEVAVVDNRPHLVVGGAPLSKTLTLIIGLQSIAPWYDSLEEKEESICSFNQPIWSGIWSRTAQALWGGPFLSIN